MFIQQLYTNCLAQAAYYIEDSGEAVIIDPLRDVDQYIDLLDSTKTKLKYIFETHFHADFVSGHLDLAKRTGATIVFGPDAKPEYEAYVAKDGEKFKVGNCTIELLHTPGHTIESSCFLLYDEKNVPHAIFSGDTVFVGDVGRPDLLSGNLSKEVLAGMLYESIQRKIIPLNDDIVLYPGHGAGSACGRNLSKDTYSTIGAQKKFNYALQPMSKEKFINAVTIDQPLPPAYFFSDAAINKKGYTPIENILHNEMHLLHAADLKEEIDKGVLVLDVRAPEVFATKHVKSSFNIGLDGTFAIWAGTILPVNTKLILICPFHKAHETITRLARVGFENIVGYWDRDIEELEHIGVPMQSITTIDPHPLEVKMESDKLNLIDVRNIGEFEKEHLRNSKVYPLNNITKWINELNKNEKYYLVCAGGYRSMIAASYLQKNGFNNIVNVNGGMALLRAAMPQLIEVTELI